MRPMRQNNAPVTRSRLEKRANEYDLTIRKDGQGNFMLVDIHTTGISAYPQWLNDLDAQNEE